MVRITKKMSFYLPVEISRWLMDNVPLGHYDGWVSDAVREKIERLEKENIKTVESKKKME